MPKYNHKQSEKAETKLRICQQIFNKYAKAPLFFNQE